MKFDVRTNFEPVQRRLKALRSDIRQQAVARALNRTAEQGRTRMAREVSREFNIRQGEVRSELDIRRARPGAGTAYLVVELNALKSRRNRGRGMNVIRFVERQVSLAEARRRSKAGTLNQVVFKIRRTGGSKRIPGAFIATNPKTGGTAVFMREGRARLPIKPITTIDVQQMFNTKRINKRVVDHMLDVFPKILEREVDYYVRRFNG